MGSVFLPNKPWVIAAPWVSLITNTATYYYGPGNNGLQPYKHLLKIVKIQMSASQTAGRTGGGAVSTIDLTVYKNTTSNAIMNCQQTFPNDGSTSTWAISSTTVLTPGYEIITASDDLIIEIAQVANGSGGTLRNTYTGIAVEAELWD